MLFLKTTGAESPRLFAVFGVGLVGSAIVSSLRRKIPLACKELPYSWTDGRCRRDDSDRILQELRSSVDPTGRAACLNVIWSAGSCGFGADDAQAVQELQVFRETLQLVRRLRDTLAPESLEIHNVSSAGGLFEGCGYVTAQSLAKPMRPYGHLKIDEEAALQETLADVPCHVYRLSSVYGEGPSGARVGLPNLLLWNGLQRRVSHVYSASTTMRDYVHVADVGEFIAQRATAAPTASPESPVTLATGRPTATAEVIRTVEVVLRGKLYVTFSLSEENSRNITFSANCLPKNWRPRTLLEGLGAILDGRRSLRAPSWERQHLTTQAGSRRPGMRPPR